VGGVAAKCVMRAPTVAFLMARSYKIMADAMTPDSIAQAAGRVNGEMAKNFEIARNTTLCDYRSYAPVHSFAPRPAFLYNLFIAFLFRPFLFA